MKIKQHFVWAFLKSKKKVDKDLLSKILYGKLFGTLKLLVGKSMLFIFMFGMVVYTTVILWFYFFVEVSCYILQCPLFYVDVCILHFMLDYYGA